MKRGEEWWRVARTLHPAKRPVYRGLRGKGEEWRVFGKILCRYLLLQHTDTTPLSLHSFYLISECDCKSTQFARRIQLFPTIPLRFSCKWGKKKSERGKEWGKRRTPEEKRRISRKIFRNQRSYWEIRENNIIYTSKTSDIKKYSYFCRIYTTIYPLCLGRLMRI